MKNRQHILNSFHLKIIGMLSMIFDHIIVIFEMVDKIDNIPLFSINLITIFRIIGRFSFIIFSFVTVEGIINSSNKLKYILRLAVLSISMDLIMYLATGFYIGNPITTLCIGALTIYFLENKNIWKKFFSIIPIVYILLISLEVIPLKADYDIYGLSTIILFYIAYILSNVFSKFIINYYKLDEETFSNSSYKITLRNTLSAILFLSFSMIIYFLNPIWNNKGLFTEMNSIQVYSIFALIPILLYNGERGYNKKWFKYGCYLFFPLHIIIIYLISLFVL